MLNINLPNGTYLLSGIDVYHRQEDWYDEVEGVHIILNDVVYDLYYDHDDGYRSYGGITSTNLSVDEVKFKFPPQLVEVRNIENKEEDEFGYATEDYKGICIFDANNGKLVFEAGTDYSDDYYPCAHYSYHPENLSINEGR